MERFSENSIFFAQLFRLFQKISRSIFTDEFDSETEQHMSFNFNEGAHGDGEMPDIVPGGMAVVPFGDIRCDRSH
jgi:hypothetical protein